MTHKHIIPALSLVIGIMVFIWSSIAPYHRITWWMEVAPVIIATIIMIFTYKKFPLTTFLYGLALIHALILMIGGHYTYARVPLFDMFGHDRNNYDKLGHFAQGFIPAIAIRELMIRTSPIKAGKWLFAVIVFSCLGISALYEIIEWAAALLFGQDAAEFLGTQGDVWDTQKDMAWAGIGAICALVLLSKIHNRFIQNC